MPFQQKQNKNFIVWPRVPFVTMKNYYILLLLQFTNLKSKRVGENEDNLSPNLDGMLVTRSQNC